MEPNFIIAIDGPAASGKSSVAKAIAHKLGIQHLSSGLIYRALAYLCYSKNIAPVSNNALKEFLDHTNINVSEGNIRSGDRDLTELIKAPQTENIVADYAKLPKIREFTIKLLRNFAHNNSIIMDGRDITTVVFPNADFKFYLFASSEERARRRLKEFQEKHPASTIKFEEIIEDINKRDLTDTSRSESPLKIAKDAHCVDNTKLSLDETIELVYNIIQEKRRS